MRILASADWHIKLTQKSVPKEWAVSRYRVLFEQMHSISLTTDLHIIAGDILDKLPNMEELALYFEYIKGCTTKTIIFSGNHEMTSKTTTFLSHLKQVTSLLNPIVSIIDDYYSTNEFDIIPYNKLKDYEKNGEDTFVSLHNKLLFTHVRGSIPPHVKPEIDLTIFNKWKTVIGGDLHSYSNSQLNILYPGSPVTTSFHRSLVDTGVIIFDTSNHSHEWKKLEVPQLLRKTVNAGDPMPATEYHHTVYEVLGDMAELGAMEDNDLIDKKVAKRDSDTALILDPTMTMQEELSEYLKYILALDDATVDKVLQTYNNNKGKIVDD